MAKVEAVKQRKFKFRQSPTEHLPKLPVRCIVSAPSSGGKSNLVVQLITNQAFYRGCFDRIYYFSASADLDSGLLPVKRYCEDELEMDPKENPCLRNTWDEGFIAEAIENQRRIVTRLKAEKSRDPLPQLLLVCDDFADSPKVVRGGILDTLFVRGRHMGISVLVLSQKYRLISPVVRVNCTALFVFRLRNYSDLQAIVEENSALADAKTIRGLYDRATSRPYGFLFIDLLSTELAETFYASFEARLVPRNSSSSQDPP